MRTGTTTQTATSVRRIRTVTSTVDQLNPKQRKSWKEVEKGDSNLVSGQVNEHEEGGNFTCRRGE